MSILVKNYKFCNLYVQIGGFKIVQNGSKMYMQFCFMYIQMVEEGIKRGQDRGKRGKERYRGVVGGH